MGDHGMLSGQPGPGGIGEGHHLVGRVVGREGPVLLPGAVDVGQLDAGPVVPASAEAEGELVHERGLQVGIHHVVLGGVVEGDDVLVVVGVRDARVVVELDTRSGAGGGVGAPAVLDTLAAGLLDEGIGEAGGEVTGVARHGPGEDPLAVAIDVVLHLEAR